MFRRRTLPPALEPAHAVFAAQAQRVEQARRALLSCLPVGRVEPAPVEVGLDLLDDELDTVAQELPRWRVDGIEDAWLACSAAVAEARAAIPHAHGVAAGTAELEQLLGAVADVVEPLDAWGDAERAWRRLTR